MTGRERLPGRPPGLPDLFGWVESGFPAFRPTTGPHSIRIEESLDDETYVLRLELPGVDPESDVEITVADGTLTVTAERGTEQDQKRRTEFRYGSYSRSVRLPAGARGDEATASYKDGVLTVSVPVPESGSGTKTIQVRTG